MKNAVFGAGGLAAIGFAVVIATAGQQTDPRSAGGGECIDNAYNCADAVNPLPKVDNVWLEELTWIEVRDAMKAGKTTIIISTGGIEPNGPWLTLGKHNYVMRANCEAIARELGNALCAPIVPFVPEGSLETRSGHLNTPGTISLSQGVYEAMLTDIATSFQISGFQNVVFIGDSGGNEAGMKNVAAKLNAKWSASPTVVHIPEHYASYDGAEKEVLRKQGVVKEGQPEERLHDSVRVSLNVMATDPDQIRWKERVAIGKATLNGVSFADKEASLKLAREVVAYRAKVTVAAIRKALAAKGT
jgi:creatinine amidohydrolase